mgnify:CR=1 FL=1
MKKTKTLMIRMSPEEHKQLKLLSVEMNLPMVQIFRQAIAIYVAHVKPK